MHIFLTIHIYYIYIRRSHQKHQVHFSWGLSAIQAPTKLLLSVRLDKILDLQEVLKDYTVIFALYMKT
jgi:hypothetical protein